MMLSDSEFFALFTDFEHSAIRLESRGRYDVDKERPQVDAFLAGEMPQSYVWDPDPWTDVVSRQTSAGKCFRRTRVLEQPYSDYNRYSLYTAIRNVTAGEDIRYLYRDQANELDLPDHDFWVFDSKIVAELRFTADDRLLGADLISEPEVVAQHEAWAKLAFDHATLYRDYIAEDPGRANLASRSGT